MGWLFEIDKTWEQPKPPKKKDLKKTAQAQQVRHVSAPTTVYTGKSGVPYLFIQALRGCGAVAIGGSKYHQAQLSKIKPFQTQDFRLLKANKRNSPEGIEFDAGTLLVFSDGALIGNISPYAAQKHGFKSAKNYRGYVLPPCSDCYEKFPISDCYELYLFPNGAPL